MSSDAPIFYDWAGAPVSASNAPVTSRPGQALNSTAQGGILALGADSSGTARTPRVDANGTVSVALTNPAGAGAYVQAASAAPAASSQYGALMMGRQDLPTPSTFYPLTLDPVSALNVHPKSKPTFCVVTPSSGVTAGQNVTMISLWNGGSMVLRMQQLWVYVPPSGAAGAVLGSNATTYYALKLEIRRYTTAFTGGTSLTPNPFDTADSLSTGVSAATGTTVGTSVATLHRFDAVQSTDSGLPFYGRSDPNAKVIVIRPGEGIAVICVSSGTINNAAGSATTTAVCDLDLSFTQALA